MKKLMTILVLALTFGVFAAPTVTMTDQRDSALQGREYLVSHTFAAATQCIRIKTGTVAPRVSISMFCFTTDTTFLSATLAIKEGCTLSTGATTGTALTAYNINRGLQNTVKPGTVVSYSPGAVSDAGTALPTLTYMISPGIRGDAFEFDPISSSSGWILKPSTLYHLTITPSSAVPTTRVRINWKE